MRPGLWRSARLPLALMLWCGSRRINAVLVAVRELLKHAVASGDAPTRVLSMLY